MSAFQATIGGRFALLATLVDEDADLDSMATHFNKAVIDIAAELLGKQRRKRKPWVTPEVLDLCDPRRDLKKKRGEPEGAKDYRQIKRKIRTEMKMAKDTWGVFVISKPVSTVAHTPKLVSLISQNGQFQFSAILSIFLKMKTKCFYDIIGMFSFIGSLKWDTVNTLNYPHSNTIKTTTK